MTVCPALEAGVATTVIIYNSVAQSRTSLPVRFPAGFPSGVASYAVFDSAGNPVTAQVVPLSPTDTYLRGLYGGSSVPVQWLVFVASTPAAGYSAYFIVPAAAAAQAPMTHISTVTAAPDATPRLRGDSAGKAAGALRGDPAPWSADTVLTNGVVSITLDGSSGAMKSYSNGVNGITVPLTQEWLWYNSSVGNAEDGQPSGASHSNAQRTRMRLSLIHI